MPFNRFLNDFLNTNKNKIKYNIRYIHGSIRVKILTDSSIVTYTNS